MTARKFADAAGITELWAKVKAYVTNAISGKADTGHSHNTATTTTAGFLPQLGGGTTNFLRADGTWAAPPASEPTTYTVTLTTSGWSSNSKTVTASGVTANNTVVVSPAPASMAAYTEAGVKCTAQSTDSLTFTCSTTPSASLTVNIVLFDGDYSTYYTGTSAPAASLGSDGDIYLRE